MRRHAIYSSRVLFCSSTDSQAVAARPPLEPGHHQFTYWDISNLTFGTPPVSKMQVCYFLLKEFDNRPAVVRSAYAKSGNYLSSWYRSYYSVEKILNLIYFAPLMT